MRGRKLEEIRKLIIINPNANIIWNGKSTSREEFKKLDLWETQELSPDEMINLIMLQNDIKSYDEKKEYKEYIERREKIKWTEFGISVFHLIIFPIYIPYIISKEGIDRFLARVGISCKGRGLIALDNKHS